MASQLLLPQVLGASTSFFLCGYAFSATNLGSAALALSPLALRLAQWRVIYQRGAKVSPPLSIAGALAWGYAAWSAHAVDPRGAAWKTSAAAAGLTVGVVGWTLLAMMPTNQQLLGWADVAAKGGVFAQGAAAGALEKWDRLNLVRAAIALTGGLVGLLGATR